MFRGLAAVNVDDKGRINIPAQFRQLIQDEAEGVLVLTIDTENRCLLLYPLPQWQEIEEKLEKLPSFHPATRRIQRLLIGHATEVELDKSGRILLPTLLREYAGLDKTVMFVGQGRKFELWSEALWEKQREGWIAEGMSNHGDLPADLLSLSL